MYVPGSPDLVLARPSPIRGTVDAAHAAAACAGAAATDSREFQDAMLRSSVALATSGAQSIATVQSKIDTSLMPGARLFEESSDAAKKSFTSYAAAIDRIHGEARRLREVTTRALEVIRGQATEIEVICEAINVRGPNEWSEPPKFVMPQPQPRETAELDLVQNSSNHAVLIAQLTQNYEPRWRMAAITWQQAHREITDSCRTWKALVEEREQAERALIVELQATVLGRLIQAGGTGGYPAKRMVAFGFSGEMRGRVPARGGLRNREVEALLSGDFSAEKLAEEWEGLGLSADEITALPIDTLAKIAQCNGLPAWVRDLASQELLYYSLVAPEVAFSLMGFTLADTTTLDDFRAQTLALYVAWQDAQLEAEKLAGQPGIQLLTLGRHDGVLTAAISHGDLDTSSHLALNISGMFSNVGDIGHDAKGARSLYSAAYRADPSQTYAAVTWIGYRSPGLAGVNLQTRAHAGGAELAGFIDGIYASRAANSAEVSNLTVFGHSYGSTTAAAGLTQTRNQVDALVTYGSAGISASTPVSSINAVSVYATQAAGDQIAQHGRYLSHPVDPRVLPEVQQFSSGGGDGYLRVTSHDMFTEDDAPSLLNWGGNVGYLTAGTQSVTTMGQIWAKGET